MDVSTIGGLVSGLNSATQIAKAILGMKIDSEVKSAIIELQNSLIAVQSSALSSLTEREELFRKVQQLESALIEKKDWDEVRKLFGPVEYENGHVAYFSEDSHWPGVYFLKCIENKNISRMQETKNRNGFHKLDCLQCQTSLKISSSMIESPPRTAFL